MACIQCNAEGSASSFPQICIPHPVELQNRNTTKWYSDVQNLYKGEGLEWEGKLLRVGNSKGIPMGITMSIPTLTLEGNTLHTHG